NWAYSFENLDQYDSEGVEINYSIDEVEVAGYDSEVEEYNLTNTQQTIELSGQQVWKDDNESERPEAITVQMMKEDRIVAEQTVTADKDWSDTFTDLPQLDQAGKEFDYRFNELPVPGYVSVVEEELITSTRAEQLDIEGTK